MLGLKILNMLVTEFNQPTAGRTMTQHRKLAVAFRDAGLLKVFQIAVAALQLLASNAAADDKLRELVRRRPGSKACAAGHCAPVLCCLEMRAQECDMESPCRQQRRSSGHQGTNLNS